MIKNLRDINPGMVVETRDHGFYVVISDGFGRIGLFNERGTWARVDGTKDMFFDDGKKEVIRIYGFTQTLPLLDQISEGIKFVYDTARQNTKEMFKIWESETEEATELKRELTYLRKQKSDIDKKLATCSAKLIVA